MYSDSSPSCLIFYSAKSSSGFFTRARRWFSPCCIVEWLLACVSNIHGYMGYPAPQQCMCMRCLCEAVFAPRIASMAPKLKAVSELGTVVEYGNGWRAWVRFGRDVVVAGPVHYGRAARREAEADLAQARQASTRDEMQRCLQYMSGASRPKPSTSPAEPSPQLGQQLLVKRARIAIESSSSAASRWSGFVSYTTAHAHGGCVGRGVR